MLLAKVNIWSFMFVKWTLAEVQGDLGFLCEEVDRS
jgi:hypothetical protein